MGAKKMGGGPPPFFQTKKKKKKKKKKNIMEKLKRMHLKYKISKIYYSHNGRTKLADIEIFPSKLKALEDKIHANLYPGINIDNLPFFVPIAIKAQGQTMIHDWVYENRAIYFTELNRL